MKFFLLLVLFIPSVLMAQDLTASSISELKKEITAARFVYQERGKIYGFNTTQSCLYSSKDFFILRHYCYPVRRYPARSYTIISKKFGMIEIYEETLSTFEQREIIQSQYPEILKHYLNSNNIDFKYLNALIEKLYYVNHPACWTSNASDGQNCNVYPGSITQIEKWFQETQSLVSHTESWKELLSSLEDVLTKP